jgi:hypothetical protein
LGLGLPVLKNLLKIGIVFLIMAIAAPLFAQVANSLMLDMTGKSLLEQLPDIDDEDENSLLTHDIAGFEFLAKFGNPVVHTIQIRAPKTFEPPVDPFFDVLLRPPRA